MRELPKMPNVLNTNEPLVPFTYYKVDIWGRKDVIIKYIGQTKYILVAYENGELENIPANSIYNVFELYENAKYNVKDYLNCTFKKDCPITWIEAIKEIDGEIWYKTCGGEMYQESKFSELGILPSDGTGLVSSSYTGNL